MKVNKLLNIFLLPSLALLAACTQEELANENAVTTLFAGIEQPAATKTSLSGPTSGIYKTIWSENDAIGVFVGDNEASEFKLKKGDGTTRGEFQGAFKDMNGISMSKTAVYPYGIVKGKSGSSISVSLPSEQAYKEGNIAEGAYPMVAVTDGVELNFKNPCSILKISMTGSLTVNSIVFTPNNSGIKVSGDATIDPDNTSLTMTSGADSRVALICGGVSLSGTATDFHIVVPAQKYTDGFSITIDTDKGKVLKTIKSDVTLTRSELYRITPFECKINVERGNITFEDANFKAYIVANFDKDNDGEISYEEARDVTRITINTNNISSLVGIEYMINLQYIRCMGVGKGDGIAGELKSIDLSKNTKLYYINVSSNPLSSLDVSNNTKLQQLYCDKNNLSSLDISNNPELETLYCNRNNLSSLDVKNNPELKRLDCYDNNLSSLNICNNQKLQQLHCNNNNLSSLDISYNPKLQSLDCDGNNLSSLDVNNNPELYSLSCNSNNLSSLDISNNSNLGILYCNNNNLSSLDVSNNPKLDFLYCNSNNLSSLDISNNPNLRYLHCNNINLSLLDISNNPELEDLSCDSNNLSSLDVSNNPNLVSLYCNSNNLSLLDISNNSKLKYFSCNNNKLSSLDISHNLKLYSLSCNSNNLSSLDISMNTSLKWLYATNNPLTTLYIYSGQKNGINSMEIPPTTNIVVRSESVEDTTFSITPMMSDIDGDEQDITATLTTRVTPTISCRNESAKKIQNSEYDMFTVSTNTTSSTQSAKAARAAAQCAAVDKANFIPLAPPVMVMVDE